MKTKIQPLILSLKPCYAELVFKQLKTVELRRRIVRNIENCEVFVYVSSPIMALRGGFRVGTFWTGTPEDIWNIVENIAQVEKKDFDTYFDGQKVAYAFEITKVWESEKLVPLNDLREQFPNFVVPQSWRYVRKDELQFFRQIMAEANKNVENSVKKTKLTYNEYIPVNR